MDIQEQFTNPEGIRRYGSERAAFIACAQDIRWQEAVENEKFAERLAAMYGHASVLQELESIHVTLNELLTEQRKTNKLLQDID